MSRTQQEFGPVITIEDNAGVNDSLDTRHPDSGATVIVASAVAAAPITAGFGCTQLDPRHVSCPTAGKIFANLGGGNDTYTGGTFVQEEVSGGPGNDTLTAGNGPTTINGGPGNDTLSTLVSVGEVGGGAPADLRGDADSDVLDLSGRTNAGDKASGGPGADLVTYKRRTTPVTISPDGVANDGSGTRAFGTTEGDNVAADVEVLQGGSGNDHITGNADPDIILGEAGSDILDGGGGNDTIAGGSGNDTERGGPGLDNLGGLPGIQSAPHVGTLPASADTGADTFDGGDDNDELFTADGVADTKIDCGRPNPPEFGETAHIDLVDPIALNCEVVDQAPKNEHPTVRLTRGSGRVRDARVTLRLQCPRQAPDPQGCRGKASVVKGKSTVGSARYAISRGATRTVRVELTRAVSGYVSIRTAERARDGRPKTTGTRLRLRG